MKRKYRRCNVPDACCSFCETQSGGRTFEDIA
jgi:hypothetical protein